MFKQARKRKHPSKPDKSTVLETKKPDKESEENQMVEEDPEERYLSQVLFGDSKSFLKILEEAENENDNNLRESDHIDSGIDSGSSESDSLERKPAWTDDDDAGIDVGEALEAQHRKLPSGGINDKQNKYSNLLKHKFESIVGTPEWANLNKRKVEDNDLDDEILRSCGFNSSKIKKLSVPSGQLEYKKVNDLNSETYSEGPFINAVEFHPTSSVALVAGNRGVATLFAVDGKKNNKLHSIAFERYPILCAKFINNGDEAILGSRQAHMFAYDLQAAKALRYNLPHGMTQCKNFVVSPNSQFLAVAGKWGEVHLLSTKSKEKIATIKQDSECTALEYSPNGNLLFGHSDTGEVTVWDMNTRRVSHKFVDEGCLQGTTISISSSNQYIACGSAQGVVNLYTTNEVLHSKIPKPKKAIMNLTTSISSLKFNPTSEVLVLGSSDIKNSLKVFHVGSGTVFDNFPPFESKLGHLNCVNFSPGSGYLALGNRKSVVSLFRLKHFKNY